VEQTGKWFAGIILQTTSWLTAHCLVEKNIYVTFSRFFQVLPRICFSRIVINSVLCEALGDRISGGSSGITLIANSSDPTCLKLGNRVSCTIFLLFYITCIRTHISSDAGFQHKQSTHSVGLFCSVKSMANKRFWLERKLYYHR